MLAPYRGGGSCFTPRVPAASMTDIKSLCLAVAHIHRCDTDWLGSEPVHLRLQGRTLWQGDVEVLRLHDHPRATRCYAWRVLDQAGTPTIHAVLHLPPVDCAEAAVRSVLDRSGA